MPVNRRQFLAGAASLSVIPNVGRTTTEASLSDMQVIEAKAGRVQLVDAEFGVYPETEIWGFDGGVPGPLLRYKQGETLSKRLFNALPDPTSIHWHGLRVPNAMDGVPGITQAAVQSGESFDYRFRLPDAGTYWYHSHNQSTVQVARGLYGVLVVEEMSPPDVDQDIVVILDDWRLGETAQITEDFGAMHDWTHAGRLGNYIHANLSPMPDMLRENERVRLRFVNVATDRVMTFSVQGARGAIVARDGMPLVNPEPLQAMVLGPAERADAILDVSALEGEALQIVFHEQDAGYLLKEIPVEGVLGGDREAIQALPDNPIRRLSDISGARVMPLRMQGGAMGSLREGIYKGEVLGARELVQQGQIWTFNGVAGLPDEPFLEVARGEIVRIPMTNDTVFAHAMHMHGTHFQEMLSDGSLGPLKDTLLMAPRESREIAFVADNPGDWLLHCHMLSHQSAGMKTWLRVL